MTPPVPSLAVGVITYRRPDRLERLLASLATIALPTQMRLETIVIVDNDAEGSAKLTVDRWLDRIPGLNYVSETSTGLSVARNKAIDSAASDWIAFIDDDEEASRDWLIELTETQVATKADAVMGNTVFAFEATPPPWLVGAKVYNFEPAVGHEQPTKYLSTNNLLVRTSITEQLGPLFDDRFAKTGGEDHHLGHRLTKAGLLIVQSHRAWTTEWVPAERMKLRVIAKRLQRDGNTLAIVDLADAQNASERRSIKLRHLLEGFAKLPLGIVRGALFGARSGRGGLLRGVRTSLIGIGQLKAVAGHDVVGYHVAENHVAENHFTAQNSA
ncbi:MAG: glycosyltransferase family 2 protein [Acidimicrobiales bacterium]